MHILFINKQFSLYKLISFKEKYLKNFKLIKINKIIDISNKILKTLYIK